MENISTVLPLTTRKTFPESSIYIYIYNNDNKYILDVYIFNPWKIFCDLMFHEVLKSF